MWKFLAPRSLPLNKIIRNTSDVINHKSSRSSSSFLNNIIRHTSYTIRHTSLGKKSEVRSPKSEALVSENQILSPSSRSSSFLSKIIHHTSYTICHKSFPLALTLTLALTLLYSCSTSQKSQSEKKESTPAKKPEWVISRPVDKSYYQGIGVAMVNTYTQGHVEEAKKKALNDLTSEISVTVKSTSMMQQVERNEELNSMYQNLTKLTSENSIEGYELVASWGDEKEYWVYYRLSKSLYNANKQRKLDRAKAVGEQFYQSGRKAVSEGNSGRAYEDFVKGLAAIREYLDAELTIETAKGTEYLADALTYELIELNRVLVITASEAMVKARISQALNKEIGITVRINEKPAAIPLVAGFTKGTGEVAGLSSSDQAGKASVTIQRITGGENQQMLEISPDIEGMTAEPAGQELVAKLVRLKTGVPSAKVSIESNKMTAFFVHEVSDFGQKSANPPMAGEIKKKLAADAFVFTESKEGADYVVKFTGTSRKGDQIPLKDKTLYTAYVDLFLTVTEISTGKQVFYKGISGEKGSRAGDFDKARLAAEEAALLRFEKEVMPEVGRLSY